MMMSTIAISVADCSPSAEDAQQLVKVVQEASHALLTWCLGGSCKCRRVLKHSRWSSNDLQVVKAEDLLLSAIIPAQQGQEIEHGLGQEALLTELAQAGGSMPLAQLALV